MCPFAFIPAPYESSGQDLFITKMAAISRVFVFVLLTSFLHHFESSGHHLSLLCEYCGAGTKNMTKIDDLFHLCCNRMASDLMRSQE